MIELMRGDCLEQMKKLSDNSVDSIVTDPPYGLRFMGKKWDYDVPSKEIWQEALRVLKPGGHLLSFGGTRTYHRLVVAIEDAGFEIRDQIQWIYGSGFPKSHNIKDGDFKGWGTALKPANEPICVARKPLEKGLTVAENVLKYGTGALNIDESRISMTDEDRAAVQAKANKKETTNNIIEGFGNNTATHGDWSMSKGRWPANVILDEQAAEMLDEQSIAGGIHSAGKARSKKENFDKSKSMFGIGHAGGSSPRFEDGDNVGASRFFKVISESENDINSSCKITSANSAENNLKTTQEIEQNEKTPSVLKNVMQFLDSVNLCLNVKSAEKIAQSIELDFVLEVARTLNKTDLQLQPCQDYTLDSKNFILIQNLVSIAERSASIGITKTIQSLLKLCGSAQVVTVSSTQGLESVKESGFAPTRFLYQAKASKRERNAGLEGMPEKVVSVWGGDEDNLSEGKKSTIPRQNHHPTVKPIKLMEYLIKLVTPPNGTVLDPFMGSGSTGVAAKKLGFKFIGCEMNEEYLQISEKRIEAV